MLVAGALGSRRVCSRVRSRVCSWGLELPRGRVHLPQCRNRLLGREVKQLRGGGLWVHSPQALGQRLRPAHVVLGAILLGLRHVAHRDVTLLPGHRGEGRLLLIVAHRLQDAVDKVMVGAGAYWYGTASLSLASDVGTWAS